MHSSSTSNYLAAFGLGYSLTTLKERINNEGNRPNKRALLNKSVEQLKTYRECYTLLFGEALAIPFEYVSDSQMVDFFSSLFEVTEERILNHCDKNLQIYFCAGGLIYLSDGTNVIFDKKKFKVIFYEILCELGSNVTWNEMGVIASQLYCNEVISKKAAKKQILDFMFLTNKNKSKTSYLFYSDQIYQSLLA